jgi:hypothetical protein
MIFFNFAIYETMWKIVAEPGGPQWQMAHMYGMLDTYG